VSTGYPKTKTGSELNLLKLLYTEEEANIFIGMPIDGETPREASKRLGMDENLLASELEKMAKKGTMYRERKDGKVFYSAPPFVVGILEFQIKRMISDPELAMATATYSFDGFLKSLTSTKTPHQRVIPVNKDIVSPWPIATYDDAVAILDQHELIAVANCMCRVLSSTLGVKQCDNSLETCIGFDAFAEYYLENGFARQISKDEAISIFQRNDKEGLVLQPMNTKDVGTICGCCGDCCAMMLSLKMHPSPAEQVKSAYYAAIDVDGCIGCEVCVDRCQIDAITMNEDEKAVIDLNRCLGCGLCVTTCPTEAASLIKKEESLIYQPPEDHFDMYVAMAKDRGIL
jgi:ferredoxin